MSTISRATAQRIGAWSGLIGPLLISLGITISSLAYQGVEGQAYRPWNHFVSELGQIGVSDLAVVFNLALIIGGVFNLVFLIYLSLKIQGWTRYPLLVLGATAAIFGGLVGIFPMNNLDSHIFVALGFFDLGLLVSLTYSLVFLFGKEQPFPKWLAIPGLLNAAAFLVFINFPTEIEAGVDFQQGMEGLLSNRPPFIPLALMEWVVIGGIIIWFLLIGCYSILRIRADRNQDTVL